MRTSDIGARSSAGAGVPKGSERRYEPGELYVEASRSLDRAFTFAELGEAAAASIGFEDLEEVVLAVPSGP